MEMGITPYMLSGDMKKVADAVAAELGIAPEHVYAEAFPERKVEVVKELQDSGKRIAFVGDGINDLAALAHASVSVSFAGATDMARETAEIVLMDDDLLGLIKAIRGSQDRHAHGASKRRHCGGPQRGRHGVGGGDAPQPGDRGGDQQRRRHRGGDERLPSLAGSEGWRKLLARRQKSAALPVGVPLPALLPPAEAPLASQQPANGHSRNGSDVVIETVADNGRNGSYGALAPEAAAPERANGSNGHNGRHVMAPEPQAA